MHGTVVEELLLRDVVQIGLGLLHGADGTQDIGIDLLGLVCLGGIILALKRHVIGIAGGQDQVVSLHSNGIDDLAEEGLQQRFILQLRGAQIHQQLMLLGACHLGSLKGDIDEILADGAG